MPPSSSPRDMVGEKLITPKEAVLLVAPESLSQLLAPGFDPDEWKQDPDGRREGCLRLRAPPAGRSCFRADDAVEWTQRAEQVVLVRHETAPTIFTACSCPRAF